MAMAQSSTFAGYRHLDGDGYLYLTDKRANMIISGGVNIYPQETENVLLMHERVANAAVFGIPHADFGEQVVAVVRLESDATPSAELADELVEFCRARLSHIRMPAAH